MAVSKTNIGFFLTSLDPDMAQTILSQSLGGFISTSTLYPHTTLTADFDRGSTVMNIDAVGSLSGLSYVNINSEIVKTNPIAATTVTVDDRGVNQSDFFHLNTDRVFGLTVGHLFSDKVNDDLKQYRCVAIKNSHATDTAFDVSVYLKQNTVNASSIIRMAVEMPRSDYRTSTVTSSPGNISFTDTALSGSFDDNHFAGANLTFTGGSNINQSRVISSYTDSTGTFVLDSGLPFAITPADAYKIDPGPAQRIPSGLISPSFETERVTLLSAHKGIVGLENADRSNLFTAANSSVSASINVNKARDHGGDLEANDVTYVWLERTLIKDADQYTANSAVLTVNYFTA